MSENPAAPDGRLDLIARIAGLQRIPGNVHHLESLTRLRAFATTLTGDVTVDSGTFAEFVQQPCHADKQVLIIAQRVEVIDRGRLGLN